MRDIKKIRKNIRNVPLKMLLKGTGIIMVAPFMVMIILFIYGKILIPDALLALGSIFLISLIFVRPYIANLSALTNYVEELAKNNKAMPPDLSFLNNVEALSTAVERLQNSWEIRKNQLVGYLGESKMLINSLPNILILLDKDLKVVQTNTTAQSTFSQNGMQETLDFIINDESINRMATEVLSAGDGQDIGFSLPAPISRDYIVKIEKFPILSPRGIAIIILMHDITALKRTEQAFADFVANASHEIRTPLTSIVGFIETLRTSAKDDPKAREQFLKLMDEQAGRMSSLVKDLLSLSQIERKLTTKPTTKIDIKNIIKENVRHLEWTAEEKSIKIKQSFQKGLPKITADENEIGLVAFNLIGNAIKYGKEGTQTKVDVSVQDNNFENEKIFRGIEKLLAISVEDEGEGIAKEHIERLTERFYRVDKARSRKVGGTGLGLSIVKHILDRHLGTMTIESELGKGSKFTVWLPILNS